MFTNIGNKIKSLAKVLCVIEIIISIIAAIGLFSSAPNLYDDDLEAGFIVGGILCLILGPLLSWIFSFALYGFGELIENTAILVKNTAPITEHHEKELLNEKLSTLDRLKNDGLITEEDYLQKKSNMYR